METGKKAAVKGGGLKLTSSRSGTQSATRSICIGTLYANCLKTISVQNSVQNARFDWGKSGAQVESGAEKWLE